ncbi:CD99 antigen-like protein 2 isoform X2 [Chiloscyllium plagiosum]|uniref:CD99 antigen-like protein 2 isoform X2 n=1 Tax=Chiloscyllium plagiosum TaxID=36176 RepID=UPI001CB8541A|nr:CD99 antigen-like protein 2 isoform X2 [Chiloscyllium plagiosum]
MSNALRVILLCATFTLLTGQVLGGSDDFDLFDAISDDVTPKPTPAKPHNPSGGKDSGDFNIWDLLQTTPPSRKTPKSPKATKKTPKKGNSDPNDFGLDFDLSDAIDDRNDNHGKGGKDDSDHPSVPGSKGNDKPKGGKRMGTSNISDKDLEDLLGGGDYKPDKKNSGGNVPPSDQDQVAMPETTIAGIASAIGAALLGAVSSYIAYQKKQLCFKIQGSLNQQYVKGENAEAGAMSEPQAERSLLQTQSEKPPADNINQV